MTAGTATAPPLDLPALLCARIRDIPDHPRPGVVFKDLTPLFADHVAFAGAVDAIVAHYGRGTVDKVVGIEARGFVLAAPVAYHFGAGFVPARKKGRLPAATYTVDYQLEYGTDSLDLHRDALRRGDRVIVVDDVLATGGTAAAAVRLVQTAGAMVVGCSVAVELSFLSGRARLTQAGVHVQSLLTV